MPLGEGPIAAPFAVARSADDPYPPGTPLGRYLVLQSIGQGGMGRVYACFDPQLDRRVAVKLILPEGTDRTQQRLMREARAMARLSHRNVVAVHDVGTVGDRIFVAMEFVEGGTLRTWLEKKPRSIDEVLHAFRHAARGLAAAHAVGLVHRDFKPENVLVARNGRVCVTDFGLAREIDRGPQAVPTDPGAKGLDADAAPLTQVGMAIGTVRYMAPEQLRGHPVDARTDEFAFCVTLWEALYGQHPFDPGNDDEALIGRVLSGDPIDPPRRAGVPLWLQRALRRGLSVDPDRRLGSLQTWARQLSRSTRAGSRWLAAAAGGVLAVAGFGVTARWLSTERDRLCDAAQAGLERTWSAAARQQLAAALGKEGALGREAWVKAETVLDTFAVRWREAQRAACHGPQGPSLRVDEGLRQQVDCLEQRTAELATLTGILKGADRDAAQSAVPAALALGSPEQCLRASAQDWLARLDGSQKVVHGAAAARLAQAQVQESVGQFEEAERLALAVVEDARKAGIGRDAGRAWLQVASCRRAMSQLDGAQDAVLKALLVSETEGDPALAAQAWAERAHLDVTLRGRPEAALEWVQHARAALTRQGGDSRLAARLQALTGAALGALGRDAEALEAHQATAQLEEKLSGESLALARALTELGEALLANDRAAQALEAHQHALSIRAALLPRSDVQLASSHNGLGRAQLALGHPAQALEEHRQAAALLAAAWPTPHLDRVRTLVFLAAAQRASKDPAGALATQEEALFMAVSLLEPEHPTRVALERDLGRGLLAQGRSADAAAHLARAVDDGAPDIERATLLGELAEAELARRAWGESARRATASLALRSDGWVRFTLARALKERGDARGAAREGAQALAELEQVVDRRAERVKAWLPKRRR